LNVLNFQLEVLGITRVRLARLEGLKLAAVAPAQEETQRSPRVAVHFRLAIFYLGGSVCRFASCPIA